MSMAILGFSLYAGGLLMTVTLGLGLVYWVRSGRQSTAANWFVVANVGAVAWALASLAEVVGGWLGLSNLAVITLFELNAVGRYSVPVAWFVFALYFTGRTDLLTRRLWAGLAASYVVPVGLVLTNRLHRLMFVSYDVTEGPFRHVVSPRTALNWGFLVLSVSITVAGVFVLGRFALFSRRVSRRQFAAVLLTPVPAWLLHIGGRLGLLVSELEYGAIGTAAGMGLAAWALFRDDLFAVEPVARDTVVSNVRDGIVTVDRGDRVVDFNDAALDPYPELAAAVGQPLGSVAPDLLTDIDGADDHADDPGTRFADEVVTYPGGERAVYNVVTSPVTVDDELRGHTLTLRDVTAVREREEQLKQETKQLDEFVSTVSHDLRNPLTVAQGYVETAKGTGDEAALTEAQAALDRMEAMIGDALALAREGRAIDERAFVSLSAVVRDAWRDTQTPDATLAVDFDGSQQVYADEDRLRRLLENLFRNAVEHGAPGSQTESGDTVEHGPDDVAVRVGWLDHGGSPGFYVADDGPGVPPGRRRAVFERGHTTSEDGTGLGLAIVDSIADAHGWTVDLGESQDGGARFSVTGVESRATPESDAPDTTPKSQLASDGP